MEKQLIGALNNITNGIIVYKNHASENMAAGIMYVPTVSLMM
jgi:hypothetical protein